MVDVEETNHGHCATCEGKLIHLCNTTDNIQRTWGLFTCRHCGKEKVDERHICKQRIQHLNQVCTWCGEVSDDPEKLCNPEDIDESKLAIWKEIVTEKEEKLKYCKGCHQPVKDKGHICDPKLPYTCKYCGKKISNSHHMCKEIIEKAKYTCNVCGRLSVDKDGICAPILIK